MVENQAQLPVTTARVPGALATMSSRTKSLAATLDTWERGQAAPKEMFDATAVETMELRAALEMWLTPASPEAIAVLLTRLFGLLPVPVNDVMDLWMEHLSPFPESVLDQAMKDVERSHLSTKHAPLPAHVVKRCEAGMEYKRARQMLGRLGYLEACQRGQARIEASRPKPPAAEAPPGPAVSYTPKAMPREPTKREADADLTRRKTKVEQEMAADGGFE